MSYLTITIISQLFHETSQNVSELVQYLRIEKILIVSKGWSKGIGWA